MLFVGCLVSRASTSGISGQLLRWLDSDESWSWMLHCWRYIYAGAELRPEDRCFFPFSFGPFIGFWAAFEGARQADGNSPPVGTSSEHTPHAVKAQPWAQVTPGR